MTRKDNLLARATRRLQGERRLERQRGRRRTDDEANRGWVPAFMIALTVAGTDWLTKWLIRGRMHVGEMIEVVESRAALWYVQNDAMILGLYGDVPREYREMIALLAGVLGALLLVEVVGRGHRLPPSQRGWVWVFVGLASGGMLGNLGERALHWSVTDFLSFRWGDLWLPPGNVADLALFAAIPISFVVIYFELTARAQRRQVRYHAFPSTGLNVPAAGQEGRS